MRIANLKILKSSAPLSVMGKEAQHRDISYFMVGLSIQTCCGYETCAVLSAGLKEY